MKKKYYLIIGIIGIVAIIAFVSLTYYVFDAHLGNTLSKSVEESSCEDSGGTVKTQLCCQSVGDFPDMCLIGACGCSPANSYEIKVCDCGEGKCWNATSTACVSNSNP